MNVAIDENGNITEVESTVVSETSKAIIIADLERRLTETDYKAIKYAEGWLTAEEYAPIKAQRQAWRNEINQLQQTLNTEEESTND